MAVTEALWWIDVVMSLACGVLIPFLMFTRQEHRIGQMTAVWLLPVVAAEVAAASGGCWRRIWPTLMGNWSCW